MILWPTSDDYHFKMEQVPRSARTYLEAKKSSIFSQTAIDETF